MPTCASQGYNPRPRVYGYNFESHIYTYCTSRHVELAKHL